MERLFIEEEIELQREGCVKAVNQRFIFVIQDRSNVEGHVKEKEVACYIDPLRFDRAVSKIQ